MYRLFNDKVRLLRYAMVCIINLFTIIAAAQPPDSTASEDAGSQEEAEVSPGATQFDAVSLADQHAVQPREVDRQKAASMKGDANFWYADEAPKRTPPKPAQRATSSPSPFTGTWFRDLVWFVVVIGFLVILILFLRSGHVLLFQRTPKVGSNDADEQPGEDLFEMDYESRAQKAIATGAFRYATRFLYLGLLKEMALKKIIRYGQERTNRDYLDQLWGTDYYQDFSALTRSFEYTWYGKFNLSEEAFRLVERDFIFMKKRLIA